MASMQQEVQKLLGYIEELETENKELQKHIYNIQQEIGEKNEHI